MIFYSSRVNKGKPVKYMQVRETAKGNVAENGAYRRPTYANNIYDEIRRSDRTRDFVPSCV